MLIQVCAQVGVMAEFAATARTNERRQAGLVSSFLDQVLVDISSHGTGMGKARRALGGQKRVAATAFGRQ